jgi:metal-responsive CopG/Arc/MetJ family transcriptional regulator
MKIETTISLKPELIQKLNRLLEINDHSSLSELIKDLLRSFLAKVEKPAYDLRELELINKNADRLNQEAEDVLSKFARQG